MDGSDSGPSRAGAENLHYVDVSELSQKTWLVGGIVPGINRHPEKKISPDEQALMRLLHRWRDEACKAGRTITRIAVAFEAGRDGFWLARWLRAHGIEAYLIHPTSIPVSREHRRAKTDRLDIGLLKRAFLGWLRGEADHCSMAAIPTLEEEDAKRPTRERENLVGERTRIINRLKAALTRFGIRGFNPKLRRAPQRLATLRTEVRYIQRRAADHDSRIVAFGQLVLFSTDTGDAWLLDRSDFLAVWLARDG